MAPLITPLEQVTINSLVIYLITRSRRLRRWRGRSAMAMGQHVVVAGRSTGGGWTPTPVPISTGHVWPRHQGSRGQGHVLTVEGRAAMSVNFQTGSLDKLESGLGLGSGGNIDTTHSRSREVDATGTSSHRRRRRTRHSATSAGDGADYEDDYADTEEEFILTGDEYEDGEGDHHHHHPEDSFHVAAGHHHRHRRPHELIICPPRPRASEYDDDGEGSSAYTLSFSSAYTAYTLPPSSSTDPPANPTEDAEALSGDAKAEPRGGPGHPFPPYSMHDTVLLSPPAHAHTRAHQTDRLGYSSSLSPATAGGDNHIPSSAPGLDHGTETDSQWEAQSPPALMSFFQALTAIATPSELSSQNRSRSSSFSTSSPSLSSHQPRVQRDPIPANIAHAGIVNAETLSSPADLEPKEGRRHSSFLPSSSSPFLKSFKRFSQRVASPQLGVEVGPQEMTEHSSSIAPVTLLAAPRSQPLALSLSSPVPRSSRS